MLVDYADHQFLVREETVQAISNGVAVAVTLALPRLLILIQILLPILLSHISCLLQVIPSRSTNSPGRLTCNALQTFRSSSSVEEAVSRLTHEHLGMRHIQIEEEEPTYVKSCRQIMANFREDKRGFTLIGLSILSLLSFFIAVQTIAVVSQGIVSSRMALSNSDACGIWSPSSFSSLQNKSLTILLVDGHFSEVDRYVADCYGEDSMAESCSMFSQRKIDYTATHNAPCPFAKDYCLGNNSAFELDTGIQDSLNLGINLKTRYYFRQKMVCAPLINTPEPSSIRSGLSEWLESHHMVDTEVHREWLEWSDKRYGARPNESYLSSQHPKSMCAEHGYQYRYAFMRSTLYPAP